MAIRVLILGGTTEGRLLSEQLRDDARFDVLLSFAGRTERLQRPDVPHRVGGFGGAEGLSAFLMQERFDAMIDATHPFAARISRNAVEAATRANVPLLRVERPAWTQQPGDAWIEVETMEAAARALGDAPRRVFLTIGRQECAAFRAAPQHDYLVRAIDPFEPGLPHARLLLARGPFPREDEEALLVRERIEIVVSKNAGTQATYAKIEAARALGLPVVMVTRPRVPPAACTETVGGAVRWLAHLHETSPSMRRGV